MGAISSFLFAYVLGGLTFIPLVIIAVLAHAHYTFPYRQDLDPTAAEKNQIDNLQDGIVQPGDDTAALEAVKKDEAKAQRQDHGVAAGYFAVCREWTPMGTSAKPIERTTPVGTATVTAPSPSVYQTMYRSLFERKAANGQPENSGASVRPRKAGNVFYIVLRHGHLMLFDDDEQLEVRHVISLAHHDIDIYSGGDVTPEGELFIKRNALRLKRREDGKEIGPDTHVSKPFFLFSENCSAKEDFYFALLRNQEQTFAAERECPTPQKFDVKNIISLVQKLHASEDHIHSRWLNALLGRIFLGVYKTSDIENHIREKITKKISRVKKPSFLTKIALRNMDMGDAAPMVTNLRLKDLTVEGECVVEADIRYTGNFRGEVAATAKLDLGPRFKSREVDLVLAVVLHRLEGHILFKVKPPPSNRIWFSFQTMPKMEMSIEPIVSARQITYTVILRQIESRIKEVFAETLVQPFWDDVPFFKTEHKKWRGGIWEGDDAVESSGDLEKNVARHGDVGTVEAMEDSDGPTRPFEKSHSMPAIDEQETKTGLFGRRLSKSGPGAAPASPSPSDIRSVNEGLPLSPRLKTTAPEAVVGTVSAQVDDFKPLSSPDQASDHMAALHSRSQEPSPATTPISMPRRPSKAHDSSSSSISSKEAEEFDGTDKTPKAFGARRNTASSTGSGSVKDGVEGHNFSAVKDSIKDHAGTIGRNFFARRENSTTSLASATPSTGSDNANKRANTMAAVANAAKNAQQWGWNAIQKQREAAAASAAAKKAAESAEAVDLSRPMGGGQPLPPPGTPLPKPANAPTKIGPSNSSASKRKPAPPSSAPALPDRPGEAVDYHEKRPVPAPPLPQRRRRGESYTQSGDDGEASMLVVAVPVDSEPGTPAAEEKIDYEGAWAAGLDDQHPVNTTSSLNAGSTETQRPISHHSSHGPIVAVPAAVADEDEDDYGGWLEEEEVNDDSNVTPPVSGKGGEQRPREQYDMK